MQQVVDNVVCEAPTPPTWKDRTAFDAQIDYTVGGNERRFLAIETKYTEPFTQARYDRVEYRDLTAQSGWFERGAADVLVELETNQLWRGLLLMNVVEAHTGAIGRYVVVAPADDSDALAAVHAVSCGSYPQLSGGCASSVRGHRSSGACQKRRSPHQAGLTSSACGYLPG